jgi:hypothetical protein
LVFGQGWSWSRDVLLPKGAVYSANYTIYANNFDFPIDDENSITSMATREASVSACFVALSALS